MSSHKTWDIIAFRRKVHGKSNLEKLTENIGDLYEALLMTNENDWEPILARSGFSRLSFNQLQYAAKDYYLNTNIANNIRLTQSQVAVYVLGFKLKRLEFLNQRSELEQKIETTNYNLNILLHQVNILKKNMDGYADQRKLILKRLDDLDVQRQQLIDVYYNSFPAMFNNSKL